MMSNENKKTPSSLEKLKLFYEHIDDSRVVIDKNGRLIKHPSQHTASRR